jgi:Short C-terminal domain
VPAGAAPAAQYPPAPPEPSTAQRLQELETLRATGVISDDEYAAKRQQILADL